MNSTNLLSRLASRGEMNASEFLKDIPRIRGDYVDFYPAAALLHTGYVATNFVFENSLENIRGTLGLNTKDTAILLQQLILPENESFEIDGCIRESARNLPVTFFITADGYIKLEELNEKRANRRQKRFDYLMSFLVAIIAAVTSASLIHYLALQRLTEEERSRDGITQKHEYQGVIPKQTEKPKPRLENTPR